MPGIPHKSFCTVVLGFEKLDFSLYPDREYQLGWLRNFLQFSYEATGRDVSNVTDKDVERLYVQVNKFALVSRKTCLWISICTYAIRLPPCLHCGVFAKSIIEMCCKCNCLTF